MKSALNLLAIKGPAPSDLLGKVLLHAISRGLQKARGAIKDEDRQKLLHFLRNTGGLNMGGSPGDIVSSAQWGILFENEAALSENECGVFWQRLLSCLPPETYWGDTPKGLEGLMEELSSAYAFFAAKGCADEIITEQQNYERQLWDSFYIHLRERALLHPDGERSKELLALGRFPKKEDICRSILLAEYPEEFLHESLDEIEFSPWCSLLEKVFSRAPEKAIKMWRLLLDSACHSLKAIPKTAEQLLPEWEWLALPEKEQAHALLNALNDPLFAAQLFQSAFIGMLQLDIIGLCLSFGRHELGARLCKTALANPHLDPRWEKPFKQAISDGHDRQKEVPDFNDGEIFRYCSVLTESSNRPYAYLTSGLALKPGDIVQVPFGPKNTPTSGKVISITDCTRASAPWPPERTKSVIRVLSQGGTDNEKEQ